MSFRPSWGLLLILALIQIKAGAATGVEDNRTSCASDLNSEDAHQPRLSALERLKITEVFALPISDAEKIERSFRVYFELVAGKLSLQAHAALVTSLSHLSVSVGQPGQLKANSVGIELPPNVFNTVARTGILAHEVDQSRNIIATGEDYAAKVLNDSDFVAFLENSAVVAEWEYLNSVPLSYLTKAAVAVSDEIPGEIGQRLASSILNAHLPLDQYLRLQKQQGRSEF